LDGSDGDEATHQMAGGDIADIPDAIMQFMYGAPEVEFAMLQAAREQVSAVCVCFAHFYKALFVLSLIIALLTADSTTARFAPSTAF
jgi:hypothetical protein